MAIDEARRGDAVATANGLLRRIVLGDLRALADRDDLALPHGDGAPGDGAAEQIDGDQQSDVSDDEVDALHYCPALWGRHCSCAPPPAGGGGWGGGHVWQSGANLTPSPPLP